MLKAYHIPGFANSGNQCIIMAESKEMFFMSEFVTEQLPFIILLLSIPGIPFIIFLIYMIKRSKYMKRLAAITKEEKEKAKQKQAGQKFDSMLNDAIIRQSLEQQRQIRDQNNDQFIRTAEELRRSAEECTQTAEQQQTDFAELNNMMEQTQNTCTNETIPFDCGGDNLSLDNNSGTSFDQGFGSGDPFGM